jgi:hypothetical protein
VQTRSQVIELDDVANLNNVVKTAGASVITFKDFKKQDSAYVLNLDLLGDLGSGQMQDLSSVFSQIQVTNAKGEALQMNQTTSGGSDGHIEASLFYTYPGADGDASKAGADGVPQKIRWEVTTERRDVPVTFELDDLSLPHAP